MSFWFEEFLSQVFSGYECFKNVPVTSFPTWCMFQMLEIINNFTFPKLIKEHASCPVNALFPSFYCFFSLLSDCAASLTTLSCSSFYGFIQDFKNIYCKMLLFLDHNCSYCIYADSSHVYKIFHILLLNFTQTVNNKCTLQIEIH
jgi:hypothetical protein